MRALKIDACLIPVCQGLLILSLGDDRLRCIDLLLFHGDRIRPQLLPALLLNLCVPRIGLGLVHRGFGTIDGDPVVPRVDHH